MSAIAIHRARRGRRTLLRRLTVAVLIATTGCAELPRYHAAVPAVAPPAAAPTEITVVDERPDWERHYYAGGGSGTWLANRLTCIPAELFAPSPWEPLKQEIAARLAVAPCPPPCVKLKIVSCRTVLDLNDDDDSTADDNWIGADVRRRLRDSDEERTLHYCKLKWADNPEKHFNPEKKPEDDDGSWAGPLLMLTGVAAVVTVGYSVSYLCDGTRRVGHLMHLRPGRAGPPPALAGRNYRRGVTFEILYDAEITFASGETTTTRVDHRFHVRSEDDSADPIRYAAAVGLADSADKLFLQAFHLPAAETQPPVVMLPTLCEQSPIQDLPSTSWATPTPPEVHREIERLQQAENERFSRISAGQPLR